MKRRTAPPPTDADILALNDVPVELAAPYIGKSAPTLYAALQDERAPFGFAVQNKKTGTWAYSISPGALVRYKRGELPTYRLKELETSMVELVDEILKRKLSGLNRILEVVGSA